MIESSSLCGQTDKRPFANILISNENFFGLLDSGAGISALGRNCLNFIERNNITLQPFRASISTADGSKNSIAGYCNLPVSYKGVTKNITFYAVPSLCQEVYLGLDFWQKFAIAPNIIPPIETIDLEQPAKSKDLCFHELSAEKKLQLELVTSDFPSFEKLGLGRTTLLSHHIDTGDAVPIKCRHYPLSPPRQAEVYEKLDRLLKMGIIEESNSMVLSYC